VILIFGDFWKLIKKYESISYVGLNKTSLKIGLNKTVGLNKTSLKIKRMIT